MFTAGWGAGGDVKGQGRQREQCGSVGIGGDQWERKTDLPVSLYSASLPRWWRLHAHIRCGMHAACELA